LYILCFCSEIEVSQESSPSTAPVSTQPVVETAPAAPLLEEVVAPQPTPPSVEQAPSEPDAAVPEN
jgi:hypothetical protein